MKTSALVCCVLAACGPAAVAVPPPCAEPEPKPVEPLEPLEPDAVVEVQAGGAGHCVRTRRGRVSCHEPWGDFTLAGSGARGLGVAVGFIYSNDLFACALLDGGRVACGASHGRREVEVPGALAVAVGSGQVCAATTAGEVYCWDGIGQGVPERVDGVRGALAVAVGSSFACALDAEGAVACWGEQPPRFPAGLRGTALAAGMFHACALEAGGAVRCFGALDGTFVEAGAVAVACGWGTVCWLSADGEVACAGKDTPRFTPEGLPPLTTVSLSPGAVCGLEPGGEVFCGSAP